MSARRLFCLLSSVQPHIASERGLRPFSGTGWFSAPAYRQDSGVFGLLNIADDVQIVCQSHRRDTSP
jgi:hypothetical protein